MKRNNNTSERKEQILEAALAVATRTHYASMTRDEIGREADVTGSLVQHYFGTMKKLRRAVVRKAIKDEVLAVIAQGLLAKDPHVVHSAPPALLQKVANEVFKQ